VLNETQLKTSHNLKHQPSKPRWARRKKARPPELLAAALRHFSERGYAGTRLEDVAKEVGVSKGTLYLYFPNKAALFSAVIEGALDSILNDAEMCSQQFEGGGSEFLVTLLTEWLCGSSAESLAGLTRLILAEGGNFPELAQRYNNEVIQRASNLIRIALNRGLANNEFELRDIAAMTQVLLAPILMHMLWTNKSVPAFGVQPVTTEAFIAAFVRSTVRGMCSPAP
jgi:AcrR family transcriptional regulator